MSYEDADTVYFDKPLSKIDRTCCAGDPVCFYRLKNGVAVENVGFKDK